MQATRAHIAAFCRDEAAAVSVEWVVLTAGVIALCVGAYGAFSVRPDKFDETEPHSCPL